MRLVGLAALAVLVGGAMFGVGSLGHKGEKRTKVSRRSARDRAGLAALAAAAEKVADPPRMQLGDPDLEPDEPEPEDNNSEADDGPDDEIPIEVAEDNFDQLEREPEPAAPASRWIYVSGVLEGPGGLDFSPVYITRDGETIARAYTDDNGAFNFELDAADPRSITISAETSDGWSGETTVLPARAESSGVRVRLTTELADLVGSVTDGAGRPVAFVEIFDGDEVIGSTGPEGEFTVRLAAHRAAILRFSSFGTEVARTQVITRTGSPSLQITASGRSITCALATRTRAIDANGMYLNVTRTGGGGWGMGRGVGGSGMQMPDVTVIPGPDFEALDIDVRGYKGGVTAHMAASDGRCTVSDRATRYEEILY